MSLPQLIRVGETVINLANVAYVDLAAPNLVGEQTTNVRLYFNVPSGYSETYPATLTLRGSGAAALRQWFTENAVEPKRTAP
jgi:hypothetical protein